jgi:hypothetical protein
VMNDGADRVHVVTGCGFGGVYGTAGPPQGAPASIRPAMNDARGWPLTALRLLYATLGTGTVATGLLVVVSGNLGLGCLVVSAGILALAAAAWVRSEDGGRGALASIGIVVGPLPAAGTAYVAAHLIAALGPWPLAAVTAGLIPTCATMTALMWRASRRPWQDRQPTAR